MIRYIKREKKRGVRRGQERTREERTREERRREERTRKERTRKEKRREEKSESRGIVHREAYKVDLWTTPTGPRRR